MKKSFMSNLKNFVDSNVRHRIDRVTHTSGNSDPMSDELILIERHFDDIRQFCVDAEKKISNMLQSIQLASTTPSHIGAYTQNVQAGFNNLSHNIAQQAANITSSVTSSSGSGLNTLSNNSNHAKNHDNSSKNSSSHMDPRLSSNFNATSLYQSSESLCHIGGNLATSNQKVAAESNSSATHELRNDTVQKFKKLPVVALYKFLYKHCNKVKQDSLLAVAMTHCSQMQAQLTNLYLTYEQMIDGQCLKPIQQMLETDIPNVFKLKKLYVKVLNDVESIRNKYNGASQKQQLQIQSGHLTSNTSYSVTQNNIQQSNVNKLDQLKNELDEAVTRFEQAKDVYEAELFSFVCREPELVNLLSLFYQLQAEYHRQVNSTIQNSLPLINETLVRTPRKFVFGTALDEHRRCTGRRISPVIELCVHFLHSQGLREEGLFRIPGSSVKIKKLKNGINALFVTLMSLSELKSDQGRDRDHSCVVALYDLFKSAVGQPPQQKTQAQSDSSSQNLFTRSSSSADQTSMHQIDLDDHSEGKGDDTYILDVHSIAGLLKLYLRELPEPVFTYVLYDSWIDCVSHESDSPEQRLVKLYQVAKQLPQAHHDNLKHLIKFLNELTQFQDSNKMTSTNLAIAMAPSLIWSKPVSKSTDQEQTDQGNQPNDVQSLNSQMCSFGMSASQHAMILESLINNAATIFPEPSDFSLSEFANLSLKFTDMNKRAESKRGGRSVKSTSPTGLSTASSSSFSSTASNSTASSTVNRSHSRKGGSMEGLLGGVSCIVYGQDARNVTQRNMSTRTIGRPVSVQIRRDEYPTIAHDSNVQSSNPPPKPPMPSARYHASPMSTEIRTTNSSHKPPAPPVPPPTSVRYQQERLKAYQMITFENPSDNKPQPVSLRGTGTINYASASPTLTTARPSVPPPERPTTTTPVVIANDFSNTEHNKQADHCSARETEVICAINQSERVYASEAQQLSSPIISSSVVSDDDSSFDNEDSPDRSSGRDSDKDDTLKKFPSDTLEPLVSASKPTAHLDQAKSRAYQSISENPVVGACVAPTLFRKTLSETSNDVKKVEDPPPNKHQPPRKPPRCTSPKITQSTPL